MSQKVRSHTYLVLIVAGVVLVATGVIQAEDLEDWAAVVGKAAVTAGAVLARIKTPPINPE
mgnify:CR=1 FL=1